MNSSPQQSKRPHRTQLSSRRSMTSSTVLPLVLALLVSASQAPSMAFTPSSHSSASSHNRILASSLLQMTESPSTPMDDDIAKLQAKARALLEKSKAKLVQQEQQLEEDDSSNNASALPFFAAAAEETSPNARIMSVEDRRNSVTKSTDASSGLIRADGDKMAQRSESEQWERRRLEDVFQNELQDDDDVYSVTSKHLADRDVAASIFNLRKQLQTEDYQKIFDKRNRFIGEDN